MLHLPAIEGLAAHQIVRLEGIVLLELYVIGILPLADCLYLAVGCTHANHTSHTAHLLNEQLQYRHCLPYRQFVKAKIGNPILVPP